MRQLLFLLLFPSVLLARDGAQPPLPTITLKLNDHSLKAEVADEVQEQTMGLMFRESLEENAGMLFVMPRVAPASFWMKNTLIPLSIAYISPAGVILEIHDLEPHVERPVNSRFPNIAFALEVRRGWFSDQGILPGTKISGLPAPASRN